MKKRNLKLRRIALLILVLAAGYFSNRLKDADGLREKIFDVIQASGDYTQVQSSRYERTVELGEIPEYSGQPYIVLNNNVPELLSEESVPTQAFETYYDLDRLGRCTGRVANIDQSLMPTEPRESISSIKPTGMESNNNKYDWVDGKYIYNRCHLIGFQLTGENANEKNLITGTRYMNTEGMLPFENMVADYIKETSNHVWYRVTPVFLGDELVARGVVLERYSVEDAGEGICFNVYCYNVQPGVVIEYASGENYAQ